MYTVELDGSAWEQADALPAEALAAFAELRTALETTPWNGLPFHRDNPHGALSRINAGPTFCDSVGQLILRASTGST